MIVALNLLFCEAELLDVPHVCVHFVLLALLLIPFLVEVLAIEASFVLRNSGQCNISSCTVMGAHSTSLWRCLQFVVSIRIQSLRDQVELLQHIIDLIRCVKLANRQVISRIKDLVELSVQIPLVKQTLDTHLTHKLDSRLDTDSDLLPAARFQRKRFQIFLRLVQMLDIYTVENIEFIPFGICTRLMDDYSDPMIDDSKEKNKDCLILVSMKSLNLTVQMQYLISIHSKVTKGILDI